MTFSGCGSYRKDSYAYDEYIAIQFVLDKLESRMTALKYYMVWYFVVGKAIHIIQLDKTIFISLKTVRGVHFSILGSLFSLI